MARPKLLIGGEYATGCLVPDRRSEARRLCLLHGLVAPGEACGGQSELDVQRRLEAIFDLYCASIEGPVVASDDVRATLEALAAGRKTAQVAELANEVQVWVLRSLNQFATAGVPEPDMQEVCQGALELHQAYKHSRAYGRPPNFALREQIARLALLWKDCGKSTHAPGYQRTTERRRWMQPTEIVTEDVPAQLDSKFKEFICDAMAVTAPDVRVPRNTEILAFLGCN